jgi:hypothetical protein
MGRPRKETANANCHPERPDYNRGLCRSCYDTIRWTGSLPRHLSAEGRAAVQEAVKSIPRAGRKKDSETPYIQTRNPKVAKFVAGVAVKNFLDMEKAVEEIKPDLPPVDVAAVAQKLERDPHVQAAIQKTLEKRGLDEKSKEHFVDLLWKYTESEDPSDEKRQLQAMRLLGKAFIADSVQVAAAEPLRIAGLDSDMKRMLGSAWSPGGAEEGEELLKN